jgi:hypothetical protein
MTGSSATNWCCSSQTPTLCLCQTWKTRWPDGTQGEMRHVALRSAIAPSVWPYHDIQNHLNYENLGFSQVVTRVTTMVDGCVLQKRWLHDVHIKELTTTGKRQDVFFIKMLGFVCSLVTSSSFYKNVDCKNVECCHVIKCSQAPGLQFHVPQETFYEWVSPVLTGLARSNVAIRMPWRWPKSDLRCVSTMQHDRPIHELVKHNFQMDVRPCVC